MGLIKKFEFSVNLSLSSSVRQRQLGVLVQRRKIRKDTSLCVARDYGQQFLVWLELVGHRE